MKTRTSHPYQTEINTIKAFGFKPIMVTRMMFEDTFVFETAEEAYTAFEKMEKENVGDDRVVGWFYGFDRFLETMKEHKEKFGSLNDIYYVGD